MGYYTTHDLTIMDATSEQVRSVYDWCKKDSEGDHIWEYAFDMSSTDYFWEYGSECKWYDHYNDMTRLSKSFPDLTFILAGNGEDSEDVWEECYTAGNCKSRRKVWHWSEWE